MKKLSLEQFIERANIVHQNKFDYSKVKYINSKTPIEIVCPVHGSFWQRPGNHLTKKYGCNFCSPTRGAALTQDQYIEKCKEHHHNYYDYSKVIFTGVKNRVIIVCPIHGDFEQIAEKHFVYGCSACAGNKPLIVSDFVARANLIHNHKYDYSLIVIMNGTTSKVTITCPKHGEFRQIVKNHLKGKGCIHCSKGNSSKKEQLWLDDCGVPNTHRNVICWIGGRRFCLDGFFCKEKVIYEFLGDYWHGNPARFDLNKTNRSNKQSFQYLFLKTKEKISFLRRHGYKVISIWESKYEKNIVNSRKPFKSKKNSRVSGK